jgi:hypothetical protein
VTRVLRQCACVVVALIATACASTARMPGAVAPVPVPDGPAAVDRMEGAFAWAPARALTWADFRGRPDMMSEAVALTAYVISYDARCLGDAFTFTVESRFLPTQSWVKAAHLRERASDRTLQHERTHFDLSEVQVRRARQALASLVAPCALEDQALDALLLTHIKADAELQAQYDRETVHGINARRQGEWDEQVRRWLRDLPR